jgi:hypothetical protein
VADARLGLQAKLGSVLSAAGGSTSTAAAAQGREEEPGGGDKAHAGPKGEQGSWLQLARWFAPCGTLYRCLAPELCFG